MLLNLYLSSYLFFCFSPFSPVSFLTISVYLPPCLPVYRCVYLRVCVSVYQADWLWLISCLSVFLCVCLYVYMCLCEIIYLSVSVYDYHYVCLSVSFSPPLCVSVCLSGGLSVCLLASLYPFINLSFYRAISLIVISLLKAFFPSTSLSLLFTSSSHRFVRFPPFLENPEINLLYLLFILTVSLFRHSFSGVFYLLSHSFCLIFSPSLFWSLFLSCFLSLSLPMLC